MGPPKILKGLKNEQVNEGETIILKALISGNPHPRVKLVLNYIHIIFHKF